MREAGNNDTMRRGGPQCVGNVLQGGGTSDITVWFGDLSPFSGNGEECRRRTRGFYQTDHVEASTADIRRYMGDARGRSSAGSSGNTVGNVIYR